MQGLTRTWIRETGRLAKHRKRVLSLAGLLAFMSAASAEDAIPSVTLSCPNCTTWAQMNSVAQSYFTQYKNATPLGFPSGKYMRPCVWSWWSPIGEPVEYYYPNCTVAVVFSTAYPLAGSFEFSRVDDGVVSTTYVNTPNDSSLRDFDNYLNARSAKLPPVELPAEVAPGSINEVIIEAIQDVLVPNGQMVTDWWHGLTNQGQFVRMGFAYAGTPGVIHWVYIGDSITVQYSNGWTEKYKLIAPASTVAWQKVEGSLRDQNGRKPSDPHASTSESDATEVAYSTTGSAGTASFLAVPVVYNAPGSRIDRQGIVFVTQIFHGPGGDKLLLFME